MKAISTFLTLALLTAGYSGTVLGGGPGGEAGWQTDFFDDFDSFNADNWQDQRIWVNNEYHCYVPDNEYATREVSDGSIKLKVINTGEPRICDNLDKHGNQHPATAYVAGRIVTKNRHEFIQGKWTARLKAMVKPACFQPGGYSAPTTMSRRYKKRTRMSVGQ